MSNYLLKLQVNELGSELASLSAYTKAAVFAVGLHNPLQSAMECLDPSTSTRYPINNASSITTQTLGASGDITIGGHASLNTATVSETLNVGFLTTTEAITAAAGIKTDNITENIAGAGIAIAGIATFEQDSHFNGNIILQTGTMSTNNIEANPSNATIQFLSPTNFQQGLTFSGGITTTGDITANTLTATGSVVSNTLSANPVGGNVEFLSPITSSENITTTGEISAATLALTGALTVSDIEVSNINQTSKQGVTISGPLVMGPSSIIYGASPSSPYQGSYSIGNVTSLSAGSVGSNQVATNIILPNPNASPNPRGTVIFGGNLQLTNPTVTSNYNITGANTIELLPLGTGLGTPTVIRASLTPTVGTGCLQVSSTANGTPGTWGTVYDTVYNIPPSVGSITLQQVLTAGSIASTGMTIPSITGNIAQPDPANNYLEILTNLQSDYQIRADNIQLVSNMGLNDISVNANYGFLEVQNGLLKVQLAPGYNTALPEDTAIWGNVYDSLYNKPQTTAFSNIGNLIYPAGSTYVDLEYNPSPDYLVGDIAQFRLNNGGVGSAAIPYNNVTLTCSQFSITGASSLQNKVFTLYLTTNRSSYYYPDSVLVADNMVMVHSQTLDFSTVTLPTTPLVIPNLFLETILPTSQAGITIYLMISISKFNFTSGRTTIGVNWTGLSISGQNVDTPNGAFSIN